MMNSMIVVRGGMGCCAQSPMKVWDVKVWDIGPTCNRAFSHPLRHRSRGPSSAATTPAGGAVRMVNGIIPLRMCLDLSRSASMRFYSPLCCWMIVMDVSFPNPDQRVRVRSQGLTGIEATKITPRYLR